MKREADRVESYLNANGIHERNEPFYSYPSVVVVTEPPSESTIVVVTAGVVVVVREPPELDERDELPMLEPPPLPLPMPESSRNTERRQSPMS